MRRALRRGRHAGRRPTTTRRRLRQPAEVHGHRRPATYYVVVAGVQRAAGRPVRPGQRRRRRERGPVHGDHHAAEVDTDFFAVKLRAGDVLGASVKGSPTYLTVYDTEPREVHGSDQDAPSSTRSSSPLPGGGNAVTDYVATKAGWHYVGVGRRQRRVRHHGRGVPAAAAGRQARSRRCSWTSTAPGSTPAIFGGPGNVQLSPLSAFLAKWGITRADEDELIDAVVAGVTENIKQDLVASGLNNRFKLKILNSRDNADPWGQAERQPDRRRRHDRRVRRRHDRHRAEHRPGQLRDRGDRAGAAGRAQRPGRRRPASLNTYLTPASDRIAFVGAGAWAT